VPAAVSGLRDPESRAVAGSAVERDVVPRGPYRMPGGGRDGVLRRRGGALVRLLHLREEPVLVRAWAASSAIRLRAESPSREAAHHGIERMRFALGLDHDLGPFHARFRRDRLLGQVVRRRPWVRPRRRPDPFESLAWAICEQLIDSERAAAIQRRLVNRFGRTSACRSFSDAPAPAVLAGRSPAELEACGLAARRALAMIRASREVAAGRADLELHEPTWRRLGTIPGIGSWTLEKLAFHGQGRDDQLPAGDLAYLKLVGQLERLGRRATEDEVRSFFAPYSPYQGLAGLYLIHAWLAGSASVSGL
jgi:3-methyladenine DNA glycosylase/8-oxoguanine DNA glycosylase